MKTVNYCLATLALILVAGYSIQAQTMGNYYPLRVGNTWTFDGLSGTYTETIISTEVDTHGHTWYLFSSFRHVDSVYVRIDVGNNLMLKKNGTETLWLEFGAAKGDSWTSEFPGRESFMTTLQETNDSILVPHGMFINVHRFYFQWEGADNDLAEYYVRDIGPLRRVLYGFGVITEELVSFNGTTVVPHVPVIGDGPSIQHVYPQPAVSSVQVQFAANAIAEDASYNVRDALGREVMRGTVSSSAIGGGILRLPTAALRSGAYFLSVANRSGISTARFVVK